MSIRFEVDRTRFPYTVYVDGAQVAVIYSTHLLDLLENVFVCNQLILGHALRINRLISIIEGKRKPTEEDLQTVKTVQYSKLLLSDREVEASLGFKVGQDFRTKKSEWVWRVTKIEPLKKLVTLTWLDQGELNSTYTKAITFDNLTVNYIRVKTEEADGEADDFEDQGDSD